MTKRQCTLELIKIILIEDVFIYFYFLYMKGRVISWACALFEVTKQVGLFLRSDHG